MSKLTFTQTWWYDGVRLPGDIDNTVAARAAWVAGYDAGKLARRTVVVDASTQPCTWPDTGAQSRVVSRAAADDGADGAWHEQPDGLFHYRDADGTWGVISATFEDLVRGGRRHVHDRRVAALHS